MTSGPFRIEIPGEPVAKGRPRFVKTGRTYSPPSTVKWEKLARMAAKLEMRSTPPTDAPVRLSIRAVFKIPASWPKWKRSLAAEGMVEHTNKPDLDNIVKIVGDAFNDIVWADDTQITAVDARKYYGINPRVEVEITRTDGINSKTATRPI